MKKNLPKKLSAEQAKKDGNPAASPAAPGGSRGVEGKGAGKAGAVKKAVKKPQPEAKPAARKGRAVRPLRGGVPFICSECYEEFILPATYSRDTVTCPECLHVGKRPDEKFLQTVTVTKARERTNLNGAIFFTYLLILSGLVLVWFASPYSSGAIAADARATVGMVLVVAALLAAVLLAVWVFRYEKNRWDIYF